MILVKLQLVKLSSCLPILGGGEEFVARMGGREEGEEGLDF